MRSHERSENIKPLAFRPRDRKISPVNSRRKNTNTTGPIANSASRNMDTLEAEVKA